MQKNFAAESSFLKVNVYDSYFLKVCNLLVLLFNV
jgi:hypothetical protein